MAVPTHPTRIRELSGADMDYLAMLAGMGLDLFTPLDERPSLAEDLASILGVDADKLGRLLYGLVVAGLLTVENGRFANTPEASQFLVRGKPAYMGSAHTLWAETTQAGLLLAESLRTDRAQARHDYGTMTEEGLYATLGGLHAGGLAAGRALAARDEFGGYRAVLDAAGGSGGVSIALAQARPGLQPTVADLPHVLPVTRRFIDEAGLGERIATVGCDLVRAAVPGPFDAAVARFFTQVLAREDAQAALRNIARALRPGGVAYLINQVIDESRVSPAVAARVSVMAISFYDHGQAYTEREYRTWLAEAGFVDITREEDIAGVSLLCACKG